MATLKQGVASIAIYIITACWGGLVYAKDDFAGHVRPFVYSAVPSPSTPFFDEDNQLVRLADYKGQVVLVNLWASWCGSCVEEMPALQALQHSMADKSIQIITLNQDYSDASDVRAFLNKLGVNGLPAYRDLNMMFGQAVHQTLLPMTLLYDQNGDGIGYLIGAADWNSPAAHKFLNHYLSD